MAHLGERNKRTFLYSLYLGKTELLDEYGNATGEYNISYSNPVEARANISASRGNTEIDQFGTTLNYTKTITVSDVNCPIDEHSVLWIDTVDADKPHDYVVVSVARSIDYVVYAIRKVNVK